MMAGPQVNGSNSSGAGTAGPAPGRSKSDRNFLKWSIGIALVVTMVLLVGLGCQVWYAHKALDAILTEHIRLQDLEGTIVHFDEVLTMSARMAAATGDPQWQRRYRTVEPQLDSAIKEALKLAPEALMTEAAARTDAANLRLVAMENRAFDLVSRGDRAAALDLLGGEEYERQKRIYAEGMAQIAAGLRRRSAASLARHRRQVYIGGAQVGVALLITLFVWLNVLRMVRARLAERRRAEAELRKYHGELEQRVQERTADLKAAQQRLRIAHNKLVNAREEERRRLARELHDSIGQRMIAMRLKLDDVRTDLPSGGQGLPDRLAKLSEQCLQTIQEIRSLGHGLYPPPLEQLGLVPALRQLAKACESKAVTTAVHCQPDLESRRFSRGVEIALFRIAQEAVSNAVRHGGPKHVELKLDYSQGQLLLTIVDDGCGFVPAEAAGTGLGLTSMQDHAEAVDGTVEIASEPGRTCIAARIPVPQQ